MYCIIAVSLLPADLRLGYFVHGNACGIESFMMPQFYDVSWRWQSVFRNEIM
jgi:hypothetical protein